MAPGFRKHVHKKHAAFVRYIESIPDIVSNPDYIGVHPTESNKCRIG